MYDVIIVGGGTAGMTSAIYLLRSGKKVLVIESETFGGQIASSPRVENFPSIKEISGLEFSNNLFEQVLSLGAMFEIDEVINIQKEKTFKVKTKYNEYESKSIILAVGVKHKKIGLDNEDELIGHGLSYCAVCDGDFYRGQNVAVIGDANSALQYSIMLSDICPKVYVCTMFDKFFGEEKLVNNLLQKKNVSVIQNVLLTKVHANEELNNITLTNRITKEEQQIDVKGVFIAIGQVPNNNRYSNIVDLDSNGYIITNENCETKTPGVFVAGDCRAKKIRQLTTAVADGAIAAINTVTYLINNPED